MKEMKKIAEGKNFTACDFGKLNDLGGYVLQLGDIKIPGKVLAARPWEPQVEISLSRSISQDKREASTTPTRTTRSSTSCSAAKENTRLTASTSPSRREASCV